MRFELRDAEHGAGKVRLVVGLTGGIGSGKSAAAARFRELGVPVIDADELSRELVAPGKIALARIVERFGESVLKPDGALDRAGLRDRVFADEAGRRELEAILHPLIRQEMRRRIRGLDADYCILSIPLLLETGQRDLVDRVLVIDAPRELQLERAQARDQVSREQIEAILDAQVDRQSRLAAADDVIVNDRGLDALRQEVDAVHTRYRQIAQQLPAGNQLSKAADAAGEDNAMPQSANIVADYVRAVTRQEPAKDMVMYELPLNERLRALLRLECQFAQADYFRQGTHPWESRAAVSALLDLLDAFSRTDIKKELLQEMERLTAALNRFVEMRGVNKNRLESALERLNELVQGIHGIGGQLGQGVRHHDMLTSVKQRSAVSGGLCSFDLPVYHHWTEQSAEARQADLDAWFGEFAVIGDAVSYVLGLIRDSAMPAAQSAENGFYQQSLDTSQPNQLVRVILPPEAPYFAEISGGKHRFSVRFMTPRGSERPTQVDHKVDFKLACCAI